MLIVENNDTIETIDTNKLPHIIIKESILAQQLKYNHNDYDVLLAINQITFKSLLNIREFNCENQAEFLTLFDKIIQTNSIRNNSQVIQLFLNTLYKNYYEGSWFLMKSYFHIITEYFYFRQYSLIHILIVKKWDILLQYMLDKYTIYEKELYEILPEIHLTDEILNLFISRYIDLSINKYNKIIMKQNFEELLTEQSTLFQLYQKQINGQNGFITYLSKMYNKIHNYNDNSLHKSLFYHTEYYRKYNEMPQINEEFKIFVSFNINETELFLMLVYLKKYDIVNYNIIKDNYVVIYEDVLITNDSFYKE